VNTLLTTHKSIQERLSDRGAKLSKIPWLKDGFAVDATPFSLGASFEYLLGLISIQEAAAQFAVETLEPQPGDKVLDMCAAPGGKTTQIAAWMKNKGILVAIDESRERLYALENNLERCCVECCLAYRGDANELGLGSFDRVILDAPCSGNYVTDLNWFKKRTLKNVIDNSERQKRLLLSAIRNLKHGGTLIYTTCSLEPEENEVNVDWLINENLVEIKPLTGPGSPGLTEVDGKRLSQELEKTRRFWPDETGTQGFYVMKAIRI